jgi:hypothetical protein
LRANAKNEVNSSISYITVTCDYIWQSEKPYKTLGIVFGVIADLLRQLVQQGLKTLPIDDAGVLSLFQRQIADTVDHNIDDVPLAIELTAEVLELDRLFIRRNEVVAQQQLAILDVLTDGASLAKGRFEMMMRARPAAVAAQYESIYRDLETS